MVAVSPMSEATSPPLTTPPTLRVDIHQRDCVPVSRRRNGRHHTRRRAAIGDDIHLLNLWQLGGMNRAQHERKARQEEGCCFHRVSHLGADFVD